MLGKGVEKCQFTPLTQHGLQSGVTGRPFYLSLTLENSEQEEARGKTREPHETFSIRWCPEHLAWHLHMEKWSQTHLALAWLQSTWLWLAVFALHCVPKPLTRPL